MCVEEGWGMKLAEGFESVKVGKENDGEEVIERRGESERWSRVVKRA